jgi:hypothetical protein
MLFYFFCGESVVWGDCCFEKWDWLCGLLLLHDGEKKKNLFFSQSPDYICLVIFFFFFSRQFELLLRSRVRAFYM